jgi:chaperonin GroES
MRKNVNIKPIGERVLVRPFMEADLRKGEGKKSKLNFVLPESMTKEKSAQGKVLAVGEVKSVKVGDVIVFSKYGYDEVELDGEELYLIKEENILAVIKQI